MYKKDESYREMGKEYSFNISRQRLKLRYHKLKINKFQKHGFILCIIYMLCISLFEIRVYSSHNGFRTCLCVRDARRQVKSEIKLSEYNCNQDLVSGKPENQIGFSIYAAETEEEKEHRMGVPFKENGTFIKKDTAQTVRVHLRSSYKTLNNDEVKAMVKKYNFFNAVFNTKGSFDNDYERQRINGDDVVIDVTTGLMWHQSGSYTFMSWNKVEDWIRDLNRHEYAGYSDWRLPTAEEAASLLESSKKYGGLYIDPVFDKQQRYIWTGDTKEGSNNVLCVYLDDGKVRWDATSAINRNFVRTVRTIR